jgi:hypothetical protein
MSQAGFTPIQLYFSTTAAATPSSGNLANGELAINITDGKLFYKDNAGVVQIIATKASATNVASISFGTTGLTPSIATTGAVTVAGTLAVANGGTGITSFGTGVAAALGQNVTGSGGIALSTSPSFTTPVLGTPTSGTLSNCTVDGTNAVGYLNIPQNVQTGNYTLTLADSGDHIYRGSGGSATWTIPANSSVAYTIGTAITFINLSATAVSIAITTDTMYLSPAGTTGTRTLAQYGSATAIKITSTSWLISGSGLT